MRPETFRLWDTRQRQMS